MKIQGIIKLYNKKSLEETIDAIQFNRDALLADSKIHIFLVDSNGWNAFLKRVDWRLTLTSVVPTPSQRRRVIIRHI